MGGLRQFLERVLKEPIRGKLPIPEFHLAQCRAGRGSFDCYNSIEREYLIREFGGIVLNAGLNTIATAIDNRAWTNLVTGDVAAVLGSAENFCFVKCVDLVVDIIRRWVPDEHVLIVFDQGTRHTLEAMASLYLSQTHRYPEIFDIRFESVRDVIELQGADMIATETFQYAQTWMRDRHNPVPNTNFLRFVDRDRSTGFIAGHDEIEEMVRQVRNSLSGSAD